MTNEDLLADIDNTLQVVAREAVNRAGSPRIEYDDMLQEARVGAWQALQNTPKRDLRQYAIGAGRKAVSQAIGKLQKDVLHHADNRGLAEDLIQQL